MKGSGSGRKKRLVSTLLTMSLFLGSAWAPAVSLVEIAVPSDVVVWNQKANQAAARHLGLALPSIQACRDAGLPLYFSMFHAVIADEAGLSVAVVNQARFDGYNWGDMCSAWGLSLDQVRRRVTLAFRAMREEGLPPPPPTPAEWTRSLRTERRERPLPARGR